MVQVNLQLVSPNNGQVFRQFMVNGLPTFGVMTGEPVVIQKLEIPEGWNFSVGLDGRDILHKYGMGTAARAHWNFTHSVASQPWKIPPRPKWQVMLEDVYSRRLQLSHPSLLGSAFKPLLEDMGYLSVLLSTAERGRGVYDDPHFIRYVTIDQLVTAGLIPVSAGFEGRFEQPANQGLVSECFA